MRTLYMIYCSSMILASCGTQPLHGGYTPAYDTPYNDTYGTSPNTPSCCTYTELSAQDLIDSIYTLLDDADRLMPSFALNFSYQHDARLRNIARLWHRIAERWYNFIYAYKYEHTIYINDLYEIRAALMESTFCMGSTQTHYACTVELDLIALERALDRIASAMQRPWFGWSSTVLYELVNASADVQEALEKLTHYQ